MDAKLKVLNLINENKEILFGAYATSLGRSEKEKTWDAIASHAKALGLIGEDKFGRHMREITWQNWRKRSLEKKQRKMKGFSRRCVLLDASDKLIFHIIGHEEDAVPNVVIQAQPTASKQNFLEKKNFFIRIPRSMPNERVEAQAEKSVEELKKENLQLQNELLKRDIYLKTLEIYEKEKRLLVPPSEFTQMIYEGTDDESSVMNCGLIDPIKEEKIEDDEQYYIVN